MTPKLFVNTEYCLIGQFYTVVFFYYSFFKPVKFMSEWMHIMISVDSQAGIGYFACFNSFTANSYVFVSAVSFQEQSQEKVN